MWKTLTSARTKSLGSVGGSKAPAVWSTYSSAARAQQLSFSSECSARSWPLAIARLTDVMKAVWTRLREPSIRRIEPPTTVSIAGMMSVLAATRPIGLLDSFEELADTTSSQTGQR